MRAAFRLLPAPLMQPASIMAHAIAKPAAVFCEPPGGSCEMRGEAAGTRGVCILPDGAGVDAREQFRREQGGQAEALAGRGR